MKAEKILHLTLKKKWFDMIASGEKKEEYREIKPYWQKRLRPFITDETTPKVIVFKNGYQKDAPMMKVELRGISTGLAKPEWSNNWQGYVYIIRLGNIIK